MKANLRFLSLCLMMLCIGAASRAQLTGAISVPSTTYPDLASVITALNTQGVGTGGATVTIAASNAQTAPTGGYRLGSTVLNASLSASKPLVINGGGNTVTGAAGTGTLDAIFWLMGTDYVTINALNLLDNSTTTTATSTAANEWGYVLAKLNATAPYDGCQNVTINNCNISLNKYVGTSTGILMAHLTPTNAGPATTGYVAADANSFNKFTANTITNVSRGIFMGGVSVGASVYDKANLVGGTTAASGNTITMGGTTLSNILYGVVTQYDSVTTVQNNKVYVGAGHTGAATIYGHFAGTGVGDLNCLNNYYNLSCSVTTPSVYGIYNAGHSDAGATHNINNNEVTAVITTMTSGYIYGIYDYNASCLTLNIIGNYVHDLNAGTGTGYIYGIYDYYNGALTMNLNNNRIYNLRGVSSSSNIYGMYNYQYNAQTNNRLNINGNTIRKLTSGYYNYGMYNYASYNNGNRVSCRFNKVDSLDNSGQLSSFGYVYPYYNFYFGDSSLMSYDTAAYCYGATNSSYYTYIYNYCYGYYGMNGMRVSNNLFTDLYANYGYVYNYFYYVQNVDSNTFQNFRVGDNTMTGGSGSTSGAIYNYIGYYGQNRASFSNNKLLNFWTNGQTIYNYTGYYGTAYRVQDNIYKGFAINGAGAINNYMGYYSTGSNVSRNRIDSMVVGTGTLYGMYNYSNGANDTVSNNVITNLKVTTGTGNSIYGIYLGHSSAGVWTAAYNNTISNYDLPATFLGQNIYGIYTNGTADYKLYDNTIRIAPTAVFAGGNVGGTGIYFTTAGTLDLRNNIINVNITPTGTGTVAALRRSGSNGAGVSPPNFLGSSNSNIYYAPNVTNSWLYAEGTSTSALNTYNLTNDPGFNGPCGLFKSFVGHDQGSFTENNLVAAGAGAGTYVPTGISYAESGATPVQVPTITTDYAGVTRPNPADIGALQFSGTIIDNAPPQIGYTPVATSSYCSTAPIITATITDQTGVDTTAGTARPRLYYKKSTETNAFGGGNTSATNGWKYVEADPGIVGNTYNFTMDYSKLTGTVGTGTTIQYFLIAQDVNGKTGANIASFPTCPTSVNLGAANGPTNASPAINQFTILTTPTFSLIASSLNLCVSGSVQLQVSPVPLGTTIVWDSASVGGTFGTIASATTATYQSPLLTQSMQYRVRLYCGTSLLSTLSTVTIKVNNPVLLSTTGASQCGYGSPTISATANPGTTINWYTSASGGNPVYTGNSYTVPALSASKTYYASAVVPKGATDVLTKPLPSSYYSYFTWAGTNYGNDIRFSDTTDFYSTTVYAMSTTTGVVYVELYDSASGYSTLVKSAGPFTVTGAGTTFNGKYVLNLNWLNIPPGRYRLSMGASSTAQLHYEYVSPSPYPLYSVSSGRSAFVGSYYGGASSNYYFGFYDNILSGSCENPARTAVPITVTPAPPMTASSPNTPGVCTGSCATLYANSTNGTYTYSWQPGSLTGSPVTVCPTGSTTYVVLATDLLTGCKAIDSVTINVSPQQPAPTLSPTNPTICEKSVVQLTATPSSPFGGTGTVGTGTVNLGQYSWPSPFGGYYMGHHEQYVIRASELTAAGIQSGNLSSIAFDITSAPGTVPLRNLSIKIAPTTLNAVGGSLQTTGFTTVYSAATYTPSGTGWITIPFSTPFVWNGTTNIVVDIAENNCASCPTSTCNSWSYIGNSPANSTNMSYQASIYYYAVYDCTITGLTPGVGTTGSVYGPYTSTTRPNMRFNWGKPYNINWTNVTGLYKSYPPLSGAMTLADTNTKVYASPSVTQVYRAYTNALGCISSLSAPDTVFVNPAPNVNITPAGPQTICSGQSVTLGVPTGGTYVYQWYLNGSPITTGGNANTYTVTNPGNYKIAVTNLATGCADTSLVTSVIVNPLPTDTVTASGATTFCNGGTVTLTSTSTTSPVAFQWYVNGVAIPGATAATYTATNSGSYYSIATNVNQCTKQSNTVVVTVNTIPSTVTANSSTTFCTGGSVTLSAPTTGTGAPYTYAWYSTASATTVISTSSSYTATANGTYYVVVSSASTGCTSTSATTTVTVGAAPSSAINPSGAQSLCQGDTLILCTNPSPGLTYTWYQNGVAIAPTTSCISVTSGGTYTVKVTIASQTTCNSTTSAAGATVVTMSPLPTVTISAGSAPTTFCQGNSVTLTASSPTANTYQWYLNGTTLVGTGSTYVATAAGSYTARGTITATGCKGTSNAIAVTVNPLPTIAATTSTATTFCQGGSVSISATPATYSTYTWKNGTTTVATGASASYTASQTGVYTVSVTNGNGCTNTSAPVNVQVNPAPDSAITPTAGKINICQGNTTLIKVANCNPLYTYQWRNNGSNVGGATSCNYTTGVAGIYTVRVVNTVTGCSSISNADTVIVNAPPTATATRTGSGPICAGDSVKLTANAGTNYKYQWNYNGSALSTTDTGIVYYAKLQGSYTVTVTGGGCSTTSSSVSITVNPAPAAYITYNTPLSFCKGSAVVLSANGGTGLSYVWYVNGVATANNSTVFIADSTGIYSVKTTNSFSCSSMSDTLHVTANQPPVPTIVRGIDDTLFTTQLYTSYQWFFNNNAIGGATAPSYHFTENGAYKVRVTDANGCTGYSTLMFIMNVGVTPNAISAAIKVYPNPTTGLLRIDAPVKVRLALRDVTGKIVLESSGVKQMDLTELANGMYLLYISDMDGKLLRADKVTKTAN